MENSSSSSSSIHDSKINIFVTDKPRGMDTGKGKTRIPGRRTLADISNIPQRSSVSIQDNKSRTSSDSIRMYIEQLQKENAALVKLLADKNKVIELSETEVLKLRVTLQKMKQQNLQLAQSNSEMLAELNSVKERQKTMKHELGCKNGLIIVKNLELEGKAETRTCQAIDNENNKVTEQNAETRMSQANHSENNKVMDVEETEVCTVAGNDDDKYYTTSRKQKSTSLVHSNKKIQDNIVGKPERIQTRRQSARFKLDEPKPSEEFIKVHNVDDKMKVNDSSPGTSSSKKEDNEGNSLQDNKPQVQRKPSISRPTREAAKKVHSYKELNLVVKMRREFNILIKCSLPYWPSQINEAEAALKHQDSLRLFELAFQACSEDVQVLRDELKSYATRHDLFDDDYLGVGVYLKTVKKMFRRYIRPESSSTKADLPFEMQMEIMKRLPIKPLIRFRSVSKPWKNLIDSSKFIKDYNSTRSQKHHLLVKYRDANEDDYVPKFVSIVDYDDTFPQLKFSLTAPEFAKMHDSVEIIGSSQGLMCLYSYYDYVLKKVVLRNPSIRKSVVIHVPYWLDSTYQTVIGFGVSPHTNNPKLVKINYFTDHSKYDAISCIPRQVEVFSLSSGVWRSPLSSNLPRKSIGFTRSQLVIDGFVYWLAFERFEYDLIMSFDMTTEEFTEINLPASLKRDVLSIYKLNESLVVLESISDIFEVCVRCYVCIMEHGVPKTFIKLYTINTPATPIREVLGFTNSGKLIMVKASPKVPVFAYEPCSKHVTDIGISGKPMTFFASSFVESLLLLYHRD